MSALWTSAELRAATGGRLEAEVAVARIGFDSRQVEAGDLFVALKAARDGHDFVPAAFAAGAALPPAPGARPLLSPTDWGDDEIPLVLVPASSLQP